MDKFSKKSALNIKKRTLRNLGLSHLYNGEHKKALKYLRKAKKYGDSTFDILQAMYHEKTNKNVKCFPVRKYSPFINGESNSTLRHIPGV